MKMKKSLLKRLPKMRGKGKFHVNSKPIDIKIERLSDIPAGSTIGPIKEIIDPGAQQIRLYIKNNNDIFRVSVAFPSAQ